MAQSPQTLSVRERRIVALWAAECAAHVLDLFEGVAPTDLRVRNAIEQTRAFATGQLDTAEAIRCRGGQAGAAARSAPTPAARAAAYAAEQAAAVAHMGAHALGAAGYAGKAVALEARDDNGEIATAEAHRQVTAMSHEVVAILATLPLLGQNRSGPLAPGRLSTGHIGTTIRSIQSQLRAL